MDWESFGLSLRLAAWTSVVLVPVGVLIARQVLDVLRGGQPRDVVNPEVLG